MLKSVFNPDFARGGVCLFNKHDAWLAARRGCRSIAYPFDIEKGGDQGRVMAVARLLEPNNLTQEAAASLSGLGDDCRDYGVSVTLK